jgi:hypothetical protein
MPVRVKFPDGTVREYRFADEQVPVREYRFLDGAVIRVKVGNPAGAIAPPGTGIGAMVIGSTFIVGATPGSGIGSMAIGSTFQIAA